MNKEVEFDKILEKISFDLIKKISFFSLIIFLIIPNICGIFKARSGNTVGNIWYNLSIIIGVINIFLYLIYIAKLKEKKLKRYVPIIIWLIYIVWILITSILSSNIASFFGDNYLNNCFISYIGYTGYIFAGIIICDNKYLNKFYNYFLIVSSITCILCFISNHNFLSNYGITGPFYNSNHFSYYLIISIILSFVLFIYKGKFYYVISYIINLIMLIRNDTLGSYIAVIGTIIVFIIFIIINKKFYLKTLFMCIVFISVSFLIKIEHTGKNFFTEFKGLSKDISLIKESLKDKNIDASKAGTNRWGLWVTTIDIIKENPIIGYGMNNLGEGFDKLNVYPESTNPHNELIRQWAENGIIGLILFLLVHIFTFLPFLKNIKKYDYITACSIFVIMCYFASSLFGVSAFYTAPYYYLFLGMAIYLSYNMKCKQKV